MTSAPNDNENGSLVSPRLDQTSLCFRAPGGRMGLPRLRGVSELLRFVDDASVMVTRRQALVVRGSFGDCPEYLHRELESHDISAPNIKSYPLPVSGQGENPLVRSLENKLTVDRPSLSLSYSPIARFRNELIRDDFCVVRRKNNSLTVMSTRWSDEPDPLVEEVSPERWPGVVEGIKQVISNDSGNSKTTRAVKRTLTKAINNVDPREAQFDAPEWIDEETIIRSNETDSSRFPTVSVNDGREHWLLITVPGGHLSPDDLGVLIEAARAVPVNELFLTPEQNVVLPVPTEESSGLRKTLGEDLGDSLVGTPHRISTCPGSQFCVNAEYDSVKLARRLNKACMEQPDLASFNASHSIVIASCGDTRQLERHHSVALVPAEHSSTIDVYMGGSPHGSSDPGIPVETHVSEEDVTDSIVRLVDDFTSSSYSTLRNWATNNRSSRKND